MQLLKNLVVILSVLLFISVICMIIILTMEYSDNNRYTEIKGKAIHKSSEIEISDPDFITESEYEIISSASDHVNWDYLFSVNPDTVAWLEIPFFNFGYPIVKAPDNNPEYYIDHDFTKASSKSGAIFISPESSSDFTNINTFIHGHNMRNETMFGCLKDTYRNNQSVDAYLYLPEGKMIKYSSFAVCVTDKSSDLILSLNQKNIEEYKQNLQECSTKHVFNELTSDRFITLSTCCGVQGTSKRLLLFMQPDILN